MKFPLEGILVVCFAELYPGPYASSLLADMGAEVVMVERPTGDRGRPLPDFFAAFARGKRSVSIDLKQAGNLQRLEPLLRRADVVIEGSSPGVAARLGIDYASLSVLNPRLIYASITGFGQTGPYRDRAAHDLSYQSITGILADQISEVGAKPGLAAGDVTGALFAAIGILAAIRAREVTGRGTFLDISVTDCLTSAMAPWLVPVLNGRPPMDVAEAPANGLFKTLDGRAVSLSILQEDHFWRELCELLELTEHSSLDFDQRAAASEPLAEAIARQISLKSLAHWSSEFEKRRIAWSPVLTLEEVGRDPHMNARGIFDAIGSGSQEKIHFVRQPVKFSAYVNAPVTFVPDLGEANDELLGPVAPQ